MLAFFPDDTDALLDGRHDRDPDEIGMCFYNRTIQEGSYVTGFDHIDESGDLAGVGDFALQCLFWKKERGIHNRYHMCFKLS